MDNYQSWLSRRLAELDYTERQEVIQAAEQIVEFETLPDGDSND